MVKSVVHFSTFSPTQCGIATYTEDLIDSLPEIQNLKVNLTHVDTNSAPVFFSSIQKGSLIDCDRTATMINESSADVVSLQHEFGIYGGTDGEHVVRLMQRLKKPVVTTLHTTNPEMNANRRWIVAELVGRSDYIVVLTDRSGAMLTSDFGVPHDKIKTIRHGIPSTNFDLPESSELRLSMDTPLVLISAGHFRPTKGYETALRALSLLRNNFQSFKYIIIGKAQSQRDIGQEEYRQMITDMSKDLNLEQNLILIEEYLDINDLIQYIKSADIGLVTYTRARQNSSGILPLMLGCGRVVVSTSFDYAMSLQNRISGLALAEMNNPRSINEEIMKLLDDRQKMERLMRMNYLQTRNWIWPYAAMQYLAVFDEAVIGTNGH